MIVVDTLAGLKMRYPVVGAARRPEMLSTRKRWAK